MAAQLVGRTDPGEPEKCPVFDLHKIYSDEKTREWAAIGCRTAGIGCLDCKKPVIDRVQQFVVIFMIPVFLATRV